MLRPFLIKNMININAILEHVPTIMGVKFCDVSPLGPFIILLTDSVGFVGASVG